MNNPRRARGGRTVGARAQLNQLKSALHGHQNKLRAAAPPPFSQAPYNSLTISQVIAGQAASYGFSTKDLCTFLLTQLGLPQAQIVALVDYVSIKLRRIDAYSASQGSSTVAPKISGTFFSLTPTVNPSTTETQYPRMKRLTDTGNLSRNAVVSYSYPTHMADTPLAASADFTVFSVETNIANSTTVRFHVQWSFNGIA